MLIYLDASAIVKLVRRESETRALSAFLGSWPERVTSVVSVVEVPRAARRASSSLRMLRRADSVLARLGLVELDERVLSRAATLEPALLRTLDAIHVASALSLEDAATPIVTYDERQAAAAREAGVEVFSPGR